MLPETPRELASHPGPIASVYLDVSRDRGGAAPSSKLHIWIGPEPAQLALTHHEKRN